MRTKKAKKNQYGWLPLVVAVINLIAVVISKLK